MYGHAYKHLLNEHNKFIRLFSYDINNINEEAVKNYKKISVDNINQNKYVINRIFYNEKNGSINIVGDNNLETCLRPCISKNNELVIVSCFFRNNLHDFYDSLVEITNNYDLNPVYHLLTDPFSSQKLNFNQEEIKQEYDKAREKLILSLKDNKSKIIVDMIDKFFDNNYNDLKKEKYSLEVEKNFKKIKIRIINIKNYAQENGINMYDTQICQYDINKNPEVEDINIEQIIEMIETNEKKEDFFALLDLYDIYDLINNMFVFYIYIIIFKEYDKLYYYSLYMNYLIQLDSCEKNIRNTILFIENIIGFNKHVNEKLYGFDCIYYDFYSKNELLLKKHDLKKIKSKMSELEKNMLAVECDYCNYCHKYLYYTIKYKLPESKLEKYYNGTLVSNSKECPECKKKNIEYLISSADTQLLKWIDDELD